jgi:hypothetical protein
MKPSLGKDANQERPVMKDENEQQKRRLFINKMVSILKENVAGIPLCNAVMVYTVQASTDFKLS